MTIMTVESISTVAEKNSETQTLPLHSSKVNCEEIFSCARGYDSSQPTAEKVFNRLKNKPKNTGLDHRFVK
jgi:hypothetical protein